METIIKTVTAATLALSVILPAAMTSEASAMSAHKYCSNVAKKYANKKTDKKVFTHMVAGGVMGGLLGNALGGKKTTVAFAAGGATLGMLDGASTWDVYYENAYESCMDDMED
jgi:uncharacterized protein YcfJ